jgi:high-affinity nickel permease
MIQLVSTALPKGFSASLIAILALGFFLGMRHATDADHVVAVSTIVTRQRNAAYAAIIGALWGAGHTLTIFVVGTAIIAFSFIVSPRIGLSMELSVGLMLVLLGVLNIFGFRRSVRDSIHLHEDSCSSHSHLSNSASHEPFDDADKSSNDSHGVPLAIFDRMCVNLSIYQVCRPVLIGIVHGLAGSAAIALLVLTTIHNSRWAVAYLLIFGLGTVGGMIVITMALGSAIAFAGRRSESLSRKLAAASGWISLAFGLFLVYQIGIADGLFTGHAHWTPH